MTRIPIRHTPEQREVYLVSHFGPRLSVPRNLPDAEPPRRMAEHVVYQDNSALVVVWAVACLSALLIGSLWIAAHAIRHLLGAA